MVVGLQREKRKKVKELWSVGWGGRWQGRQISRQRLPQKLLLSTDPRDGRSSAHSFWKEDMLVRDHSQHEGPGAEACLAKP